MDFATLKSRLYSLIGRYPADICYELVTADINARLRVREMEATDTLTEAARVALPSDFLQMISVYRDVDPRTPLSPTDTTGINRAHVTSGTPKTYAIVDGAILLNPEPDGSENLIIRYYARQADLSADGDTNDILTNYPSVYVYGVLAHHAALIRDEKAMAIHGAAYGQHMKLAQSSDAKARYSGAPIVPTVRTTP